MLHNIKINKGLDTNQAKQGRFISVVLAAGEITARIRLSTGEVMQTGLVSGMAFPVPVGFSSVSFSSPISQQIKVWLGDLPLTYSSSESRMVGAAAIESKAVKVMFGAAKEIIPAQNGRGKVTINAPEPIKIGGVGVGPSSAITVPANTPFEVNTQGAIFGYSENSANTGSVILIPDNGEEFTFKEKMTGFSGRKMTYAPYHDELLFTTSNTISRYKASTGEFIQTISFGAVGDMAAYDNTFEAFKKQGNDFYTFTSKNGQTNLIKYDSITHTIEVTPVVAQGGEVEDFYVDVNSNMSGVLVKINADVFLYHGSLDSFSAYQVPDFGSFDANTLHVSGDTISVYGLQQMIKSTDKGVTFSDVTPIGFNISSIVLNESSGYTYVRTNTNTIKRSSDGETFEDVHQNAANIYVIKTIGDFVYFVGENTFGYSPDNGETWFVKTMEQLTGDGAANSVYSLQLSESGSIFLYDELKGNYRLGGEVKEVGGLDVAIMAEVN